MYAKVRGYKDVDETMLSDANLVLVVRPCVRVQFTCVKSVSGRFYIMSIDIQLS